jgi:site-specific DNA-methyltransferase (adenine-specific)
MTQPAILALGEYLTVGEAAALLGVTAATLRNWDRSGKFRSVRHPLNSYRLYRREDLHAILSQIARRKGGAAHPRGKKHGQ